jgi:putative tryptophan/tyrosine transport system substrate-binding protein
MRRREFIAGLGSAATWPIVARAQQPAMPVIGYLVAGGLGTAFSLDPFLKGLGEMGYVQGRSVAIEFRGTERFDELTVLADELVQRRVKVIYTGGDPASTLAAKAATSTIPIVFQNAADPVALGLVASINRPGGNITGVSNYVGPLVAKRLELARELVPQAALIGVLDNPKSGISESSLADLQAAARSVGQSILVVEAGAASEIDAAFTMLAQRRTNALLTNGSAFFLNQRDQLVALAARYAIPTVFHNREFAEAGGLLSYGDVRSETRRQAGLYVGRILNGEKPADLPVMLPTKFELVINMKTAKALSLTIPETLLVRADEVIQ